MAHTLLERVTNVHGTTWIRAHGYGVEGFAFCSTSIFPGVAGVSESQGQITCPDCIAVIQACKAVGAHDLAPEYENELFHRRLDKDR